MDISLMNMNYERLQLTRSSWAIYLQYMHSQTDKQRSTWIWRNRDRIVLLHFLKNKFSNNLDRCGWLQELVSALDYHNYCLNFFNCKLAWIMMIIIFRTCILKLGNDTWTPVNLFTDSIRWLFENFTEFLKMPKC